MSLPRQKILTIWPSAIGARSSSTGAPAATVSASGASAPTNGQTIAAPPTATAAVVAR